MTPPIEPVVDVCVVAGSRVLLVRRETTDGPGADTGWFLPGGPLNDFEPPEAGAARTLLEQTGATITAPFLSHVESTTGPTGTWRLAFHFVVQLTAVPTLTRGGGMTHATWFDLTKLPPKAEVGKGGWALTTIREILQRAEG